MKRMFNYSNGYGLTSCLLTTILAFVFLISNLNPAFGQVMGVKEYIHLNGRVLAVETSVQTISSIIQAPVLLWAKESKDNSIEVRFCVVDYAATNFEIEKNTSSNVIRIKGGEGCRTWHDSDVNPGTVYTYRVRALDKNGEAGNYSNKDSAKIVSFADTPISTESPGLTTRHSMNKLNIFRTGTSNSNVSFTEFSTTTNTNPSNPFYLVDSRTPLKHSFSFHTIKNPSYPIAPKAQLSNESFPNSPGKFE